jgi:trans-aconitate methyltransferase
MLDEREAPPGVDPRQPSAARLYDYYLGGGTNFQVDVAAGESLRAALPDLYDAAWANRGFHQRAARWMASYQNIDQFIDIGSGLPTQGNTHAAVGRVRPDARVAYVDNDPMVHAMAGGLLTADDQHTKLLEGDLRDPDELLNNPALRSLIDLSKPVGLLMSAVVHFVADGSEPGKLVKRYTDALAPGSYLALSHATADKLPERSVRAMYDTYENANTLIYLRTRDAVRRLFDGLEMVEPYPDADDPITYVGLWGAESVEEADSDGSRVLYCGVGKRL